MGRPEQDRQVELDELLGEIPPQILRGRRPPRAFERSTQANPRRRKIFGSRHYVLAADIWVGNFTPNHNAVTELKAL